MNPVKEISYEIDENKVRFHNSKATKIDNKWTFNDKTLELDVLYQKVVNKLLSIQQANQIGEIDSVLINSDYIIALFVKGVITKEVIAGFEEKVAMPMEPFIGHPETGLTIEGISFHAKLVIVGTFNYSSFCFISKENKDM